MAIALKEIFVVTELKTEASRKPRMVIAQFSGVSVLMPKPARAEYRQRVAEGIKALAQLPSIISKPGVKLALPPNLSRYVADSHTPSLVVQTIGKVSRRGRFDRDGNFVEVE